MCDECQSRFTFIILVVILIIILVCHKQSDIKKSNFNQCYQSAENPGNTASLESYPYNMSADFPYKTLYTGAEVDPIITGGLYAYRDNLRPIYGARTSDGGVWGLHDYCSSLPEVAGEQTLLDKQCGSIQAGPEETEDSKVGVCYDYNGIGDSQCDKCFDDGIPVNWNLPSTPFAWYKPLKDDYYSREGIKPYTKDMYAQMEPDHEPLIGEDPDPIQAYHNYDG